MKINWSIRFKNPLFWVQCVMSLFLPILVYFGKDWQDMTTWSAIVGMILQAIQNPVVIVAMITSLWGTVNDPTVQGVHDSRRALMYIKPYKNCKERARLEDEICDETFEELSSDKGDSKDE